MDRLKFLCENTLMHTVDNENVCSILIDANKYGATDLKKYCYDYLLKNFAEVHLTKGFEDL